MNIQVIENSSMTEPTEWGISFNGHNPESEDYFKMPGYEEAFRLKKKLESNDKVIEFLKDKYNPKTTTIELKDLFEFFGITEEDIGKAHGME